MTYDGRVFFRSTAARSSSRQVILPMESLWSFLQAPAVHIVVARDAFTFDISWLGVVLVVAALLIFRHLRR